MFGRELQTSITSEAPHIVVNLLSFIIYATNGMDHFIAARAPVTGMEIGSRETAFDATYTCRHG